MSMNANETGLLDALVIGAGPNGLYELYLLREKGLRVRGLEAGSGVGGTWYWNRYPGCRLHSETYTYQYFFSQEMLDTWDWTEMFASQPELERYFNAVADLYDLKKDYDFDTRVVSMKFNTDSNDWTVQTSTGREYRARTIVAATGQLWQPVYPDAPGRETFAGEAYHTSRWPKDPVSFAGKRVAVIGTGSSSVQVVPHIAREAAHLSVVMRTANWIIPLNNRPIGPEEMAQLRRDYGQIHEYLSGTYGGFLHTPEMKPTTAFTPDELQARYDEGWEGTGFSKWFGMPYDVLGDEEVNKHYSEYVAQKIRARINDPELAERLIPRGVPYGSKPVDCETDYYEVFNQDNVELVEVADDPITEFTRDGMRLASGREMPLDIIVFATGFEAFVGSLNQIEITGTGEQTLRERWAEHGPETLFGLQVSGFPNLFLIAGPHGKGGHGNSPRCAERPLEWIADAIEKIHSEDIKRFEPLPEAEAAWTEKVVADGFASLVSKGKSFLFGDNVPGRKRHYVAYTGSLPDFVAKITASAENDYEGFQLTK